MAIAFTPQRWQTVRDTYRRWWAGELDRPLIDLTVAGADPGRPEPKHDYRGYAAQYGPDVPAEDVVDVWDFQLSCQEYLADAIPKVWPNFGAGIIGGFLGGVVEVRPETVWFHAPDEREIAKIRFQADFDSEWVRRIAQIKQAAMDRWGGLVQVGMTDLGGNLDILSTFRPGERLLLDLYDEPAEVERLVWEAHEAWWAYFDYFNDILQPTNPGYSAWAGIYSETSTYMLQCDFCYMISPEMFERFVRPELVASAARLDNAFYHLDGPGQLPHLDSLLAADEIKGIQWIPGDGQPPMCEWPDVYKRIQAAGKLTQVFMPLDDLEKLADKLGSLAGFWVGTSVSADRKEKAMRQLEAFGAI
jgi:5-methyltetrahydrofolate--homocysteine methyltransferase